MMSTPVEPPTLRSITSVAAAVAAANRRSYSCYNCNHAFHITPTAAATFASSPSSFRCPRCLHRHLIPYHTVAPSPHPRSPMPTQFPGATPFPGVFTYYTFDDFDSDYDYDSDSSVPPFTIPDDCPSLPALKSFIDSLPIKTFPPNSATIPSCSICMEDFGINSGTSEAVNELPCQHYFHKNCIVEWLNRSNTCPLCRYKLPVDPEPDHLDSAEYDAFFVVDVASSRESVMRRSNAEVNLTSLTAAAEASGSDRQVISSNSGERTESDFDAMRDEDGDTLMVDA